MPSATQLSHPLKPRLQQGLDSLQCLLGDTGQGQLLQLVDLLDKWNRVYNLTAIRNPADMLAQHIFDSLSIRPFLHDDHILDVGSGAGLPGLPLAIAEPQREFVLLDSNSKKTRFINQAIAELQLANVSVVQARVEAYRPDASFSCIVSRAFATLGDFINGCAHLCSQETVLLAMKGRHPQDEIAAMPDTWVVSAEHELSVPGVTGERRCLEIMQKNV
jgi:16S rRNA (guanine527-N7)-methyltransferase